MGALFVRPMPGGKERGHPQRVPLQLHHLVIVQQGTNSPTASSGLLM